MSIPSTEARRAGADALAMDRGWEAVTLAAGHFDLAAWVPRHITFAEELTIYIEGDGLAWIGNDMASSDPTPISPMGLRLALAQPAGNAAYLARPCQYMQSVACSQRYWTAQRFAPEVIEAMGQAVDAMKARFQATRLTLVGYSGGAAVAALVAARRTDVDRLVTVAGNIDHAKWTVWHRISPLTGSLNPADERAALAKIPQQHFVGGKDQIVPPILVEEFAAAIPAARVITIPHYDHKCCWAENWSRLWKEMR